LSRYFFVFVFGLFLQTSLRQTDADCLRDLPLYLHRMWSAPLSILGVLLFLYNFLSYATFAGVG